MPIEIQHVQWYLHGLTYILTTKNKEYSIVLLDRTGSYDCEFSWAKSFNQLVSKVDIVLML